MDVLIIKSYPKNDRIYFTSLGKINGYDRGQPLSKFYTVKNRGGEWFYWRTKVAVCLGTKRANLSLGCVFSNYSIYDCRRNMVFEGKKFFDYGPRKITHSIYIEVSADI